MSCNHTSCCVLGHVRVPGRQIWASPAGDTAVVHGAVSCTASMHALHSGWEGARLNPGTGILTGLNLIMLATSDLLVVCRGRLQQAITVAYAPCCCGYNAWCTRSVGTTSSPTIAGCPAEIGQHCQGPGQPQNRRNRLHHMHCSGTLCNNVWTTARVVHWGLPAL